MPTDSSADDAPDPRPRALDMTKRTVSLSESAVAYLDGYAQQLGVSASEALRRILDEHREAVNTAALRCGRVLREAAAVLSGRLEARVYDGTPDTFADVRVRGDEGTLLRAGLRPGDAVLLVPRGAAAGALREIDRVLNATLGTTKKAGGK